MSIRRETPIKKYGFNCNSILLNNHPLYPSRRLDGPRMRKPRDVRTISNMGKGKYPVLNDTDKNIHSWNDHNQSCIDGHLCSEISSDGDSDSGKSINGNDIDNDSDEIFKGNVYYLYRTYLHTEDYTIDKYSYESLGSVDNDSNICNDENVNGSDGDSLSGFQDFKHLWVVCEYCYTSNYKKSLKSNRNICEYCGFHLKMNSSDRIELSVDSGTWKPMDEDMVSVDPIDFDTEEVTELDRSKWLKDFSEWLKEFKELFEMLEKIEEKEGAEKKEEAEKLKEWEGWERLKEKEEEEEVEGWRKQWNDWESWRKQREGWRKQREELDKDCKKLLEFVEVCFETFETKKTKECKEMRQQEALEEEKARERHKEREEWEGLNDWEKLLYFFYNMLRMDFEWWKEFKGVLGLFKEVLGLLENGAGLEEFKESLEWMKEIAEAVGLEKLKEWLEWMKKTMEWMKETAKALRLEELKEVEEGEEAEEVEEGEEAKEVEEGEEAEEVEEGEEIEEVEEGEEVEEVEEGEEAKEVEEGEEAEEVEEVEEGEEVEEAEEVEKTEEIEEVEEGEEVEEAEELKEVEEGEEAEEVEEGEEAKEVEEGEEAEEVEEIEEQSYLERLDSHQRKTGLNEAVQTGIGRINGFPVAIGFMDFEFIGGSMGSVVGEKITRLIEYATKKYMPLILVCASGGARMQEGTFSLMQMAKISCALNAYQLKRKLFYVSILTTPTTGGVTASFGMLGDIIIAEPNAHIAFAGKRIIEQLLNVTVPEGLQEAEYSFEKGLLDSIVPRNPLKGVLSEFFQLHGLFSWSFR